MKNKSMKAIEKIAMIVTRVRVDTAVNGSKQQMQCA